MTTPTPSTNVRHGERERVSFAKIAPAMELPNLISVQKESFDRFMNDGLAESFAEFSPIQNAADTMEVTFGEHQFGDPAHSIAECRAKDISYQAPLFVEVRFVNRQETMQYINDFFKANDVRVLNLDFHIESSADRRTSDHNVYTNIYTLHLPRKVNYVDVTNHLAAYSNIQVVRVTNT